MNKKPIIVAQSGFEKIAPNTFLCLDKAVELGLDFLEIQIQYNSNTVYLSHQRLDGDSLIDAPTFLEALVFAKRNNLNYQINLKNPEGLNPALQLLKETQMDSNVIFTDGVFPNVTAIRDFNYLLNVDSLSRFPYIGKRSAKELVEYHSEMQDHRCLGFSVNSFFITKAGIKVLLESQLKLSLWSTNFKYRIKDCINFNVDYLVTNKPVFAKSLLD